VAPSIGRLLPLACRCLAATTGGACQRLLRGVAHSGGAGTSVLFGDNTGFSTTDGTFILTSAGLPTFTATIPEPASLAIFGAGLAALGVMRRKRKAT
jgi:hypothetical protein